MSKYRDDLESAQLRVQTLEAKLREKDAALTQRDAALAARDAELAELRARRQPGQVSSEPSVSKSFFEPIEPAGQQQKSTKLLGMTMALILIVGAGISFFVYRRVAAAEQERMQEQQAAEEAELRRLKEAKQAAEREMEKRQQEKAARLDAAERERLERELQAAREAAASSSAGQSGTSATLRINCLPPSTVIVDGKRLGTSPVVGYEVSAGTHAVICAHDTKGLKSRSVTVKAGQTTTVAMKL